MTYIRMKYCVIFCLLIAFFLCLIIKPQRYKFTVDETAKDNYIRQKTLHNDTVAKLKRYDFKVNTALENARRKIILSNDFAALNRLKYYIEEYNHIQAANDDYLSRSLTAIMNDLYYDSEYCLQKIEESIGDLENIITAIENVEIKDAGIAEDDFCVEKEPETSSGLYSTTLFFSNCKTKEELDYRFKSLSKIYHPDNKGGDESLFKALKEDYENAKKTI